MNMKNIMDELKNRGYEVEIYEKVKNGVIVNGIRFNRDCISPIIYINSFLEEAKDRELTINEVVDAIEDVLENDIQSINVKKLFDSEFVCANIMIAVQKESTEDILKRKTEFDGVEAYLYIDMDKTYSCKLKKDHLKIFNLTENELWQRAEKNTRRKTVIKSMTTVMDEMFGIHREVSDEDEIDMMYVVSNDARFNGASGALDKVLIQELAYKLGVKGFAVLPSSIHEMLLIPFKDVGEVNMKLLNEMVWQVNHEQVSPEDRLTDRAYLIAL